MDLILNLMLTKVFRLGRGGLRGAQREGARQTSADTPHDTPPPPLPAPRAPTLACCDQRTQRSRMQRVGWKEAIQTSRQFKCKARVY